MSGNLKRAVLLLFLLALASTECKAEGWQELKIKAERGAAEAQVNVGVMSEKGEGRPQDSVEAVTWYRKAAEQGNAEAQVHLGDHALRQRGRTKAINVRHARNGCLASSDHTPRRARTE